MAYYDELLLAASPSSHVSDWAQYGVSQGGALQGLDTPSMIVGGASSYIYKPNIRQFDPVAPDYTSAEIVVELINLSATNTLIGTERSLSSLGNAWLNVLASGELYVYHVNLSSSPYSTKYVFSEFLLEAGARYLITFGHSKANRAYIIVNGFLQEWTGLVSYANGIMPNWEIGRLKNYVWGTSYSAGFKLGSAAVFSRDIPLSEHLERYHALNPRAVSGQILDRFGNPCSRVIRLYNRSTGQLQSETLSDAANGQYSLNAYGPGEFQRVVLDSDDDPLLNDLVDRVIPG